MNSKKYKCPCCGELTLTEERMFEVCPNCYWEDDNVQFANPDYAGGANKFSLNQYRKLFLQGLSKEEILEMENDNLRII